MQVQSVNTFSAKAENNRQISSNSYKSASLSQVSEQPNFTGLGKHISNLIAWVKRLVTGRIGSKLGSEQYGPNLPSQHELREWRNYTDCP